MYIFAKEISFILFRFYCLLLPFFLGGGPKPSPDRHKLCVSSSRLPFFLLLPSSIPVTLLPPFLRRRIYRFPRYKPTRRLETTSPYGEFQAAPLNCKKEEGVSNSPAISSSSSLTSCFTAPLKSFFSSGSIFSFPSPSFSPHSGQKVTLSTGQRTKNISSFTHRSLFVDVLDRLTKFVTNCTYFVQEPYNTYPLVFAPLAFWGNKCLAAETDANSFFFVLPRIPAGDWWEGSIFFLQSCVLVLSGSNEESFFFHLRAKQVDDTLRCFLCKVTGQSGRWARKDCLSASAPLLRDLETDPRIIISPPLPFSFVANFSVCRSARRKKNICRRKRFGNDSKYSSAWPTLQRCT